MQTIKEMIDLLDAKRKAHGLKWREVCQRGNVQSSMIKGWRFLGKSPLIPNYVNAMYGAGCGVELMSQDGYIYPLMTADGFIDTNSLSCEAKRQGKFLVNVMNRSGLPNGSIWQWRTGEVWPRMDVFLYVLEQLGMRLVVIDYD